MKKENYFSQERLNPITRLFKETWEIYFLKLKSLLLIFGIPIGFSFFCWILISFLAETSLKYSLWFSLANAIYFLGSIFLWLLAIPSFLYSLKENIKIEQSYKKGFKILGPFIWVYFLIFTIIIGGFLLFIFPGFLFLTWFFFAIFVLIFEEKRGFNALFRSKHLVKGKFWKTLVRFLVLGLVIAIGSFLLFALIGFGIENKQIKDQISQVISFFLQLFILPFSLIYGFLIYKNLKEIKAKISYQEPAPSKKVKYLIPGILGTLIVGLLMSLSLFNIFLGRDIPPIDDSDLWLSKIEIPKKENAFYYLLQASEKIYLPKEKSELFRKMAEGEKWNSEFAEELIKNNEEAFGYFERALELPYFQIPEFQDPKIIGLETIVPSPALSGPTNIARLNSIRAHYLLLQGKEKEALDLILKIIKMGQMLQDSPRPTLIGYLVGIAIKGIGLKSLRIMIPSLTLLPEILKDYVAELDQFKKNEEGLIKTMKMEYIAFTNTKSKIDAVFEGKLPKEELEKLLNELQPFQIEDEDGISKKVATFFEGKGAKKLNYLYKPNQTQKVFAEYYRNFVENANKDCGEAKLPKIKFLVPYSQIRMLFTENIVGKILHDSVGVSFSGVFEKKCLEDFSVIGTQVLLSLKGYRNMTGKLPTSLSELVPEYFSEPPKDPFDGKPIRYLPEKKIIYSVGKDRKDSGGSEGKALGEMKDPTFKIEF